MVAIAGFPRSGSTLLGDILGSAPGVTHLGETAVIFRRRPLSRCSCGASIPACEFWGPAVAALSVASGRDADAVDRDITRIVHGRRKPAPYLVDFFASLLRHAATRTGSRVLVDSSNWPSFGRLLDTATGGECGYIHLVRDPRAAIHSRTRGGMQYLLDGASAPRVTASVVQDSRRWNLWNRQAEKLAGVGTVYTRVRYEDLVRDPSATLAEVTTELDLPSVAASGNRVEIDRRHVIGGSRGARNGTVEVVDNDDWRRESTPTRRALVEVLTAPGRRRYGYGAARLRAT